MTSTIPTPPPERDVSAERRDAMRDAVRRRIAAERRRPGPRAAGIRRHLMPLLAAAAVAVLLGATVTVLSLMRSATPPPAHPPAPTSSPAPSPSATLEGFSDVQKTVLRNACVTELKNQVPGQNSAQPRMAKEFVDLDALRLINAVTNTDKTVTVLTDDETLVFCSWHSVAHGSSLPPASRLDLVGYRAHAQWMPGPITMELAVGPGLAPSWYLVVGRTRPEAHTVRVTAGDGTETVPVVDGTFAASVSLRRETGVVPAVQALDRNGQFLAEWHAGQRACAVDPRGTVVFGVRGDPPECVKAVPWH
ncbi:hypothetical protein [Cryptosporangium sp. NPDC051539]|uniref:hypothetical protein n=1 Tax=Cryptosporangium sp. NPDC051539 TaxID=3363962 RepID=UPI0037ABE334